MVTKLVIPGITNEATLACIARSRKYSQYIKAVADALADHCPFCNVDRVHNEIIAENAHWLAWHCNPPEKNTRIHVLYVPKRHVKSSTELYLDELVALWGGDGDGIRRQVHQVLGYTSCGTLMRDGDATLSAGTIQHLHIHDMVPAGTGRVESPFYKGAEAEAESLVRAIVFEKLRSGTNWQSLTTEELMLVDGRV